MSIFRFLTIKQRLRVGLLFVLCLGIIVTALLSFPSPSRAKFEPVQAAGSTGKTKLRRFVSGTVLVRYRSEAIAAHRSGSQRIALADGQLVAMQLEKFEASELVPGLRLARVAESETLNAIAALRAQPDVLYAEPNYILRAADTPNDPRFVNQSNMTMIGGPQAWNSTHGSPGIVVGILDQGVQISHSDLQANIWTNPQPGSLQGEMGITNDLHGYNFVNDNGDVTDGPDDEVHGTHVAGVIGAVGNNGIGITGVNWSVGLMPLKFLDPVGEGEMDDLLRACTYAKKMRDLWVQQGPAKGANLRVLNASFGNAPFSQALLDTINSLNNSGILFVAAAGNSTDDGTREPNNDRVPHYPSSFVAPNLISVGATNAAGDLATSFSHFGSASVSLGAPGEQILSTTPRCADPGPFPKLCNPTFTDPAHSNDTYTAFDGTSMAAPHVSGAAALLWAQNPNLTVQQVKNLLLVGGDIVPSLIDKTLTGRRLNIGNSFQALLENDTVAPGTATNFHINSQNGRTFNLGWTTSGDDGASGQASLYQINFTDGSSVIPLKGVVPLASGSGQIATVSVPLRHTTGTLSILEFDNAGNAGTPVSLPVGIPLSLGDPFTSSVGGTVALSTGGTRLPALTEDDQYVEVVLPGGFSFPFLGHTYTELFISSNGALYFGETPPERPDGTADDVPSSPGKLGGYTAVAGLWDDLNLEVDASRPDAGVFEVTSPGKLIYRFQARPCDYSASLRRCTGTTPVNFEIELNSNGVIKTRYGAGNANLTPTVGIGGGAQESYFIASHTSEDTLISLPNAAEITFTPRTATVSNIQLTQSAVSINEATSTVSINVSRTGDTSSVATVAYGTTDAAGSINCNNVTGTAASRRCDYLTSVGTLKFAGGETSKTITVLIINDVYLENPETFSVALSSPVGATLGAITSTTITINDNVGGGEGGTINPIFDAEFFVRQHYIDFLNREPDAGGLNFWKNEITSCGSDAQCIDVKRVNVSAAFFLSIEFQQTGYLVYRIYKAGLGNLPGGAPVPVAFTEFLRDTQEIGRGVQVGIGDWQNQLEANKQAFAIAFVQRPEFVAAYPNTMNATDVVNKMELNAGIVLPTAQKTALINLLSLTPHDVSKRAAVLRAVADSQVLFDAEFNKAFVLMQYMGYMRRSPNEAPDSDFLGFEFWLKKLVEHHGNFADADMVKSFIVSGEYLGRFQN